jgi:flagellar protein FliS
MHNQVEVKGVSQPVINSVENETTPYELVRLLMDGAVVSIEAARNSMIHQRTAEKGEAISKAIEILTGLMESLNMEQGGQISENLLSLYEYMQHKLLQANLYNRIDYLNEVLLLLKEIRSGWIAIPEESRSAVSV